MSNLDRLIAESEDAIKRLDALQSKRSILQRVKDHFRKNSAHLTNVLLAGSVLAVALGRLAQKQEHQVGGCRSCGGMEAPQGLGRGGGACGGGCGGGRRQQCCCSAAHWPSRLNVIRSTNHSQRGSIPPNAGGHGEVGGSATPARG